MRLTTSSVTDTIRRMEELDEESGGAIVLGRPLVEDRRVAEVSALDEAAWLGFDLASLIELRKGERIDPADAARERARWAPIVSTRGELSGIHRGYAIPYWVLHDGERVGTVALGGGLAPTSVHLTSLYVGAQHRGEKIASRLLEGIAAGLAGAGLRSVRLETDWCAFRALPLYLALGMRVRMWKRELAFVWSPHEPRWSIAVEGDVARCIVDGIAVITAQRQGARLAWSVRRDLDFDDARDLEGTFAVTLAARGFPLITSDEEWAAQQEQGFSDCGGPVGLALRIQQWEAWARKHGWVANGPRIPGLSYPTWEELTEASEARWRAREEKR